MIKFCSVILLSVLFSSVLSAQNYIRNLKAIKKGDQVEIVYGLADLAPNQFYQVALKISGIEQPKAGWTLQGDFGKISENGEKKIIWSAKKDFANVDSANIDFKLEVGLFAENSNRSPIDSNGNMSGRQNRIYRAINFFGTFWMVDNLNTKMRGMSYCYENNAPNCYDYGSLYTWAAAQKVCPEGWRLPYIEEWKALDLQKAGLKKGGYHDKDGYGFELENIGYYWAQESDGGVAAFQYANQKLEIVPNPSQKTEYAYSCRCVAE